MLEVKQLSIIRNEQVLASQVHFSLAPGEMLQVIGANGSGKTTLLKTLAGLLPLLQGQIFWQQQLLSPKALEYHCLYLGHLIGLKLALTPYQNLHYSLALANQLSAKPAISEALSHWGLAESIDEPCYQLSAGQLRKVALSRLLLQAVPLWILDEPFTALDHQGISQLEAVFKQHLQQGGMIILTSHQNLMAIDFPITFIELHP